MPKKIITLHIDEDILKRLDEFVERSGLYKNRSEAVRNAIILFLKRHGIEMPKGKMLGP